MYLERISGAAKYAHVAVGRRPCDGGEDGNRIRTTVVGPGISGQNINFPQLIHSERFPPRPRVNASGILLLALRAVRKEIGKRIGYVCKLLSAEIAVNGFRRRRHELAAPRDNPRIVYGEGVDS
jgi:hypothetical protein